MPGCIMDVQIGLLFKPPLGCGPKVLQILEVSSIEEIALDVFEGGFNFPFRLSPAPDRNGLALIMRHETCKGGIEDRSSAFPSEHHGLFRIVETFLRHPAIILEGILMPSDQRIKISVLREVNVLPSGETQDIGETLDLALAGPGEGDRVGTPIHLALAPRIRFKSYHRFSFRRSQFFEPVSQNTDPTRIARFLQLFIDPQTRDIRVLLQKLPDLQIKFVQLTRPSEPFGQYLMTPVSSPAMGTKNPPDRIPP